MGKIRATLIIVILACVGGAMFGQSFDITVTDTIPQTEVWFRGPTTTGPIRRTSGSNLPAGPYYLYHEHRGPATTNTITINVRNTTTGETVIRRILYSNTGQPSAPPQQQQQQQQGSTFRISPHTWGGTNWIHSAATGGTQITSGTGRYFYVMYFHIWPLSQNQTQLQLGIPQQQWQQLQQQQLGTRLGRGTCTILQTRFNPKTGNIELTMNGIISRKGYLNLMGKDLNRRQSLRNYRFR